MSALAAETLSRVDAAEGLAALLAAEQAGNALDPNPAPLQPPPAMPMMPVHNYPGGYPYGVAHHGIGVPGISVAPSAARPRTSAPPKPALTAEEVYAIAESEGLTLLRAGGATGFKCAAHPGPARRPLLPLPHARAHVHGSCGTCTIRWTPRASPTSRRLTTVRRSTTLPPERSRARAPP